MTDIHWTALGWERIKDIIKLRFPHREALANELEFDRYKRGYLYLRAPNNTIRDEADLKLSKLIYEICIELVPGITRVVIVS